MVHFKQKQITMYSMSSKNVILQMFKDITNLTVYNFGAFWAKIRKIMLNSTKIRV